MVVFDEGIGLIEMAARASEAFLIRIFRVDQEVRLSSVRLMTIKGPLVLRFVSFHHCKTVISAVGLYWCS